MWVGTGGIGRAVGLCWPGWVTGVGVAGALWVLRFRLQVRAGQRRRERRTAEELAAYARLDVRIPVGGEGVELAKRVSRIVAESSPFSRVAVLIPDVEGRIAVAASAGMDDSMAQALNVWGGSVAAAERGDGTVIRRGEGGLGVRVGATSFAVIIGLESEYRRAIVTPLWTMSGHMLGALAVGADSLMSVRRSALRRALEPLEALAFKVERSMENAALAERLIRAERLAGLGLMAGGMAHALNNPLTAVLGFAELIVDTTGEARVKEDAEIIVREALRIRETMETLMEFWRPAARSEEMVDVTELVRGLVRDCAEKLENRGVRLAVQVGEEGVAVRGDRDRLRQMIEHLLNNAAEALARVKGGEEQVIRVSVGRFGERVHLVVSDTGPGFRHPGRVFEPCDSGGLGLSVCYGIAHEHGGEISAFNMHPHGAAVAVDLPVVEFANKNFEAGVASVSV